MSTSYQAPTESGALAPAAEAKPDKQALAPAQPVPVDPARGMSEEELQVFCKKYPTDPVCLGGKPPPKDDPPG